MHYITKPKLTNKQLYPWHKLYRTASWADLRKYHISIQPLCVSCGRSSITAGSLHVDHIIDHKGDIDLFYDKDNLQTLCAKCHGRKSMEVIRMKNFKKDSRIVNIAISPEFDEIDRLKEQLGYDQVSPELVDTVVRANTNDKFKAKDMTQAELIARRYAARHKINPTFNYTIKGKDEQK